MGQPAPTPSAEAIARQLVRWMQEQASLGSEVIETQELLRRLASAIDAHGRLCANQTCLELRRLAAEVARTFSVSGECPPSEPGGRRWQIAQKILSLPVPEA